MNLADHFETLEPPADGLQRVRLRARRRALQQCVAGGATALLLPFVALLGLALVNVGGERDSAAVQTVTPSSAPANSGSITPGDIKISGIGPDPAGLPGSSASVTRVNAVMFYAVVINLLVLAGALIVLCWRRLAKRQRVPWYGNRALLVAMVAVALLIAWAAGYALLDTT
jgi:hypothetical protein